MSEAHDVASAAELFKTLGNEARLGLLVQLLRGSSSVGELVAETGLSQPLVSQHLRTLRTSGLVVAERQGKSVLYGVADSHIEHVIGDAIDHVQEGGRQERPGATQERGHSHD